MRTIDFSRSFFTFRIDTSKKPPVTVTHKLPFTLNNARIQVDCCCVIEDLRTGEWHEFLLGASCKTERVNVNEGIWTQPNADFIPLMSRTWFASIKTFDHADRKISLHPVELGEQPHRQVVRTSDAFDSVSMNLAWKESAELREVEDVHARVFANDPISAITELLSPRYRARIEYPVKTINVGERERFYQVDTGPVLLPDLSRDADELIGCMDLAFAAFNCDSWTEFLVRDRTEAVNGVFVNHYSRPVRMEGINRLYA